MQFPVAAATWRMQTSDSAFCQITLVIVVDDDDDDDVNAGAAGA